MKQAFVLTRHPASFLSGLSLFLFVWLGLSGFLIPAAAQESGQVMPTGLLSPDSQTPGVIRAELSEKQGGGLSLQEPSRPTVDIYDLPNRIVNWPPLRQNDSTPDSQFSEGLSRLAKNQYAAAQEAFRKVLDGTQDAQESYQLGERFAAVELFTLAAEAFQKAGQNPNYQELTQEWRQYYLPTRFLNATQEERFLLAIYGHPTKSTWGGQSEAAWRREQLKQVIEEMPDFAPAHRWLGLWSGNPKAGLPELQKAVLLSPGQMQSLETLGDSYARNRQYSEAAQAYTQALQSIENKKFAEDKPWKETLEGKRKLAIGNRQLMQNPRNASGWKKAGQGLLQQDRPDEARQVFTQSKRIQIQAWQKKAKPHSSQ